MVKTFYFSPPPKTFIIILLLHLWLCVCCRNGYKMCIRVYLNGDGTGYKTHLSLFFVLMKGEFDALLKWPFEHKISMILVGKLLKKELSLLFIMWLPCRPRPQEACCSDIQADFGQQQLSEAKDGHERSVWVSAICQAQHFGRRKLRAWRCAFYQVHRGHQ